MKKLINWAYIYLILAMISGVIYREVTKFTHFYGKTYLSVTPVMFFGLGTIFMLILFLFSAISDMEEQNKYDISIKIYNIGVLISTIFSFIRGLTQVLMPNISIGVSYSISAFAGIGHTITAIGIIMIFNILRKINIKK